MSAAVPNIVDITGFPGLRLAAGRPPVDTPARPAGVFLDNVVETMARVRAETGRGLFVLTAPHRKAGTTYVIDLLAKELTLQLDATVAVIPGEALKGTDPKRLPQGYIEHSQNIWTAVPDQSLDQMPDFALENVWVSPGKPNFDFILVDCPAITGNLQTVRWANAADGVFLVVEAGVTKVDQIEAAERALHGGPGKRLKGIVLNRRTYPIPSFLYRLL